jgi:hypothetical protein
MGFELTPGSRRRQCREIAIALLRLNIGRKLEIDALLAGGRGA